MLACDRIELREVECASVIIRFVLWREDCCFVKTKENTWNPEQSYSWRWSEADLQIMRKLFLHFALLIIMKRQSSWDDNVDFYWKHIADENSFTSFDAKLHEACGGRICHTAEIQRSFWRWWLMRSSWRWYLIQSQIDARFYWVNARRSICW